MQKEIQCNFLWRFTAHLSPVRRWIVMCAIWGEHKSDNFGDQGKQFTCGTFDQLFELSDIISCRSQPLSVRVTQWREGRCTRSIYYLFPLQFASQRAVLLSSGIFLSMVTKDELSAVLVSCLVEQLGGKTVKDLENEGFLMRRRFFPMGISFSTERGLTALMSMKLRPMPWARFMSLFHIGSCSQYSNLTLPRSKFICLDSREVFFPDLSLEQRSSFFTFR